MESRVYYNSNSESFQHHPYNFNVGKGKHPFTKAPCIVITERSVFGISKVYIEYENIGLLLKTVTDIVVRDNGLMK